jgi:hypothetical protein
MTPKTTKKRAPTKVSKSRAVARRTKTTEPLSESARTLLVLEKMAERKDIDPNVAMQFLSMQERILDRQAKMAYTAAFAEMQPQLPRIPRRGTILNKQGKVQSRYALWEDIDELIRPILTRYGFTLSFRTREIDDKRIGVTAILAHADGHQEDSGEFPMPIDTSGSKNDVQGIGSSRSYGKRYAASDILNLITIGEDDDGVLGGTQTITEDQALELDLLIQQTGANRNKLLAFAGVRDSTNMLHVPAKEYQRIKDLLIQKQQKQTVDA